MPDHRYLKRSLLAVALLFALVVGLAIAMAGDRGLACQQGILNFGKVNDNLYRGADPAPTVSKASNASASASSSTPHGEGNLHR